jgi:hypothetical protein
MDRPNDLSPVEVWTEFAELEEFAETRPEILPFLLEPGTRSDVLVMTGENASGKSLAFMILNNLARNFATQDGVSLEIMDIGMGRRTTSGIMKGLMFGDENTDSTGNISLKVMQTAVSTSRGRTGYHYLMLDEPDIGVGEGYHNAIGSFLVAFAEEMPEKCLGLVIATHSRRIVERLVNGGASSLRLGGDLRPVREWIRDGDIEKTVDDLVALKDTSRQRLLAVSAMLGSG